MSLDGFLILGFLTLRGIAYFGLWGLGLAFGLWVHRRLKLRSLPWLGIYVLLSLALPLGMALEKLWIDTATDLHVRPFGWSIGQVAAIWSYEKHFIGDLARLLLGLLILSDVAFLLSKTGIVGEGRISRGLLAVRERTIPLGIAMILSMLYIPATSLAMYLYYV